MRTACATRRPRRSTATGRSAASLPPRAAPSIARSRPPAPPIRTGAAGRGPSASRPCAAPPIASRARNTRSPAPACSRSASRAWRRSARSRRRSTSSATTATRWRRTAATIARCAGPSRRRRPAACCARTVIAPFNFPVALSVAMMSGALLGGNTVVYKPSPMAGLTGSLIVDAFVAAGLPPGAVNLVCGGGEVGQALGDHPAIAGIAFTGSHAVGMEILRRMAARTYARPVIAEMGGKNPAYVTANADLDAASTVFVHDVVADDFLARLVDKTTTLKVGDPQASDVFVGPVINRAAADRFERAADSVRQQGRFAAGGEILTGGVYDKGYYVAPAIAADLPADHDLHKEELFLPLLTVRRFGDLAAAIRDGNDVRYGLTAGIYTRDEGELRQFLDTAEAGVLYANRASGATTGAWPGIQTFCGWKGSGVTGKGGLGPWYVPQFMREQSHTVMG